MKYYYLIASLPTLSFEGKQPFSPESFLSECRKWLSQGEMTVLDKLSEGKEIGAKVPEVLKEWEEFYKGLITELANIRRKKTTVNRQAGKVLKEELEGKNPLEMEKTVEKIKWDFLSDKELGYIFDINNLVIYLLKLRIASRLSVFDKEEGEKIFERVSEADYE